MSERNASPDPSPPGTGVIGLSAIALAGPTASGKSALALELAERLAPSWPVEIVSVDSALVYRGLDIATAKPSATERAQWPHHLIDIVDPEEPYSAARFVADATRLMGEIRRRGALPLLVGGTMLYLKALREGLDEIPPADPALRAEIEVEAARSGWPALHARLAAVDPVTAARLAPLDAQRIQRALEVWRGTGRPISAWQRGTALRADAPRVLSLEPESRGWLHARIANRTRAMLDQGLLDEVRRLRQRAGVHSSLPAARMVGVRQAWESLDRVQTGQLDATKLAQEVERLTLVATRQLAKRQITWLRSTPGRIALAADASDVGLRLHQATLGLLEQHPFDPVR